MNSQLKVSRGYFGLGDHEHEIHISCSHDYQIYIWARNVETFHGGVQVMTPPSQFRTSASSGPKDGLVMDVPAQSGIDLGCIGGDAGETIDITNVAGARVTVFITIVTTRGAKINITTN